MTITTRDALIDALGNSSTRIILDKASIANTAAGQFHSLWRATGQPGQGAIPTSAAVCDNTTLGVFAFAQQTAPATSYLAILEGLCSNNTTTLEIHDRLVHMGGLSGTVATAQTVGIDLDTLSGTSNLAGRRGDDDYSDVQWWAEWYTDTGSTAATLTANVTYNDGSTGALTGVSLAASRRASFMQPLNALVPAAKSGSFIRGVNSVQLSASTGTAGNFGVTATRYRGSLYMPIANGRFTANWADLGLPSVPNGSALFCVMLPGTTSTGTVRAAGKLAQG